jgi:hypothetical protein
MNKIVEQVLNSLINEPVFKDFKIRKCDECLIQKTTDGFNKIEFDDHFQSVDLSNHELALEIRPIFVRRFDDESFIVLNLFAPDGEYLVDGKSVRLNRYDVYFSDSQEYAKNEKTLKPVFKVSYKNSNTVRTMHLCSDSASKIKCELDTEVIFAVRNGSQAYLNGEKYISRSWLMEGQSFTMILTGETCYFVESQMTITPAGMIW